jgi:hypothetical protein
MVKSNLQQELGIEIKIERDSKNNTSIIKIEKNNSGNSGEHKKTPDSYIMSSYLDSLSPVSIELSPEENQDLSTNSHNAGHTEDTGDKIDRIMEGKDDVSYNSDNTTTMHSIKQ